MFYKIQVEKNRKRNLGSYYRTTFYTEILALAHILNRLLLTIEEFFKAIKDGAWHSIDALSAQLAIPPSKLVEFSEFLSSHGMLEYEKKTKKIRIDSKWKLLLPIEEIPA